MSPIFYCIPPIHIIGIHFIWLSQKKGALNLHRIVLNNINVLIIPEIISIVLIDTYDTYNILH